MSLAVTPRVRRSIRAIVALLAVAVALVAFSAHAHAQTVYDSIPNPVPINVLSWAFESRSTSEFGDHIAFQPGTSRQLKSVTVVLSSWACEQGFYGNGNCVTTPGATFEHPITLNLYNVVGSGGTATVGTLLTSVTVEFDIPYRPSAAPITECDGSGQQWKDANGACARGLSVPITFDLAASNIVLPEEVIWSIAFNTTGFGVDPIGPAACLDTVPAGTPNANNTCGYDSLNVGMEPAPVLAGADVSPGDIFHNSQLVTTDIRCNAITTGGVFERDGSCWAPFVPNIRVETVTCTTDCYVDAATGNDTNSGLQNSPKQTIQAAVNTVQAGGNVLVAGGTYAEQVTVNKSLNVRGGVPSGTPIVTDGFYLGAPNIKLTGFTIEDGLFSGEQAGVYVQGNGAYIANNAFVGLNTTTARGIMVVTGVSGATIAGNSFDKLLQGIYLNPPGGHRLYSNTFKALGFGMSLDFQDDTVLKFNDFVGPFDHEAIGVNDALATTIVAHNQFLAPGLMINHYGKLQPASTEAGTLNAENNWWGSRSGPAAGAVIAVAGAAVDVDPIVTNRPNLGYDAVGTEFPGNVTSLGPEAYSLKELGDHVALQAGVSRELKSVTLMMSSWGCESGQWNLGTCVTSVGATFAHDITLNIYAVDTSGIKPAAGALLQTVTQNFTFPYRPSADSTCPNPTQYRDSYGVCNNGLALPIVFDLTAQAVTLPAEVIYGITYNTSNHGYNPLTTAACRSEDGGCGYDSLNIGLRTFGPFAGTNVDPDSLYLYSTWAGLYTPPAPDPLAFVEDAGWSGNQINITFEMKASVTPVEPTVVKITACGQYGSVTFATTPGVTYASVPANATQGSVTVSATADSGFVLQGYTGPWTYDLGTYTACQTDSWLYLPLVHKE